MYKKRFVLFALYINACAAVAPLRAAAAAEDTAFPQSIAFNSGSYSKIAIDKAVKDNHAELVKDDEKETIVRHLWIEVFENSKVATKKQTTVFGVCESRFYIALPQGRALTSVKAKAMVLDASGRPVGQWWQLDFKLDGAKWTRRLTTGVSPEGFYNSVSDWARAKLWLTTGFLENNPGQTPVAFIQDRLNGLVAKLLDQVPKLAAVSLQWVIDALETRELKWGRAADLTNKTANENVDTYQAAGKDIWQKLIKRE